MKVKIHTAARKVFEGEAEEVVLPGEDGEFSVLDFHQPCLCALSSGRITVRHKASMRGDKEDKIIIIKKGAAKVESNALAVLVEI